MYRKSCPVRGMWIEMLDDHVGICDIDVVPRKGHVD